MDTSYLEGRKQIMNHFLKEELIRGQGSVCVSWADMKDM